MTIPSLSFRKRGATLTGYGLIVGLIAVFGLAAIGNVGNSVNGLFADVAEELDTVSASSQGSGAETGPADEACPSFKLSANACLFDSVGSHSFITPASVTAVNVVVIGGGSAGSKSNDCGGGGSGDVRVSLGQSVSGTLSVTVGAGGPGHVSSNQNLFGFPSSFDSLTAAGGGDSSQSNCTRVLNGGSSGGYGGNNPSPGGQGGTAGVGACCNRTFDDLSAISEATAGAGGLGATGGAGAAGGGGGGGVEIGSSFPTGGQGASGLTPVSGFGGSGYGAGGGGGGHNGVSHAGGNGANGAVLVVFP